MNYLADEAALEIANAMNSEDLNPDVLMKYVNSQATTDEMLALDDAEPPLVPHLYSEPNLVPVDLGYNFDVTLNGDSSNSWLYVPNPGKIFIKMNSVMTINASFRPQQKQMFLRAMILFDNVNEMHLPVKRCANHSASTVASSINSEESKHILKCLNPYAQYKGMEDGKVFQERLSVVVPLDNANIDDAGNSQQTIGYEFGCQNSCTSGINRKSTSIVFTLEDKYCQLLGKKVVQFKVCSCPKRDAERERDASNGKRKTFGNEPFPKGKRPKYTATDLNHFDIKVEPEDSDTATTPDDGEMPKCVEITLKMPIDSMKHVLRNAFNEMCGKMATEKNKKIMDMYQKTARTIRRIRDGLDEE